MPTNHYGGMGVPFSVRVGNGRTSPKWPLPNTEVTPPSQVAEVGSCAVHLFDSVFMRGGIQVSTCCPVVVIMLVISAFIKKKGGALRLGDRSVLIWTCRWM